VLIEVLLLNRHLAHEHVVAGLATVLRAGALTSPEGSNTDVVSTLDEAGCPLEPYPPLAFGDQYSLVAIPTKANLPSESPRSRSQC
jgi:hypothetical protein